MNEPAPIKAQQAPVVPMDTEQITPDYFAANYADFLPRYISHGHPTADTLRAYRSSIDLFLTWCQDNHRHPLTVHDYQMRLYIEHLYKKGCKKNYMSRQIVAIRTFFTIAKRLGLIKENPCEYIHTGYSYVEDEQFHYYTLDQIREMLRIFDDEPDPFLASRNKLILYLMAVEGLRNVEVHRLNDEDVNWELKTIFIRGKGHDGIIYPSDATFALLESYLQCRPSVRKEGTFTPLIVSNSHKNQWGRISRNGLRFVMNDLLRAANFKHDGLSCHIFRHSCGTNLYQKTKDLRVVQETLRQRDPKTTARYAHVHQRLSHRYTSLLDPEGE